MPNTIKPADVEFAFDLCSAWTYLAAERVDKLFGDVRWAPAILPGFVPDVITPADLRERRARVAARATALRMPLVWPDRHPAAGRAAMRVAHYAAEQGRAARFVLAAGRLAYCGGFDLDDPEILAEAAAAACLPLDPCLAAMGDTSRDAAMETAGRMLAANGADQLPVVTVRGILFCGESQLGNAVAAARAPLALAPVAPPAS